jgi:hypothetical protein
LREFAGFSQFGAFREEIEGANLNRFNSPPAPNPL